ncbi:MULTISPECIES: transcription factor WhiB [Streptomyces]|uniref:Transcription factor WhiB n=1 Tax=Streptomyces glycanivorans TaxID=3033808 RepID=A0ABY9JRH8_9ACTN|nr:MULTISPECIES: transcription factor WhiB [unclassified Streptomyces]WLQ69194.1 transcription factor WhiB [Streptomyces sp. Alt3]WSR53530.1 transcription factor WhiB [Streptomyces sp. NBC_01201]
MTSTQARHTRRAVIQAAVDSSAARAGGDPDLYFCADDQGLAAWQARRTEAIRLRTGCPVRAACEELALRDGDGRPDTDEMVRAGRTGRELAAHRAAHTERLAAAVDADRDTEGRRLDTLTTQLQHEASTNPDSSRNGGPRAIALRTAAQNDRLRTLSAQIHQIRAARPARAGWAVAA